MGPQVAHRRLRAAIAADQQVAAQSNHADDRHDLDDRKPELGLAKDFDVGQVDGVDQHEEGSCGGPGRDVRRPVVDVFADRGQLRHAHQNVQNPAVPARQKAGKAAPVLVREMAEGTGHRLFDNHLAELAHDHEGDEAADGVAEDHRRAGGFQYPGRAEEQAGTDRATEGDQLNVAIFQAAFQLA
ncbi:hypothetical protein D3C85_1246480 [compost metagenome]